MQITEVDIDKSYLIYQQTQEVCYADAFQLKTTLLKKVPLPKKCMIAFFKSFSPLLTSLIISREAIVGKLGLKTADKLTKTERLQYLNAFEGNIGDGIAIFDILDKNDTELLTGQTDKHLDFKLSFVSYADGEEKVIELITVVRVHNVFGRIYFFFVKPFHRFYMKRILKRMERQLLIIENQKI